MFEDVLSGPIRPFVGIGTCYIHWSVGDGYLSLHTGHICVVAQRFNTSSPLRFMALIDWTGGTFTDGSTHPGIRSDALDASGAVQVAVRTGSYDCRKPA